METKLFRIKQSTGTFTIIAIKLEAANLAEEQLIGSVSPKLVLLADFDTMDFGWFDKPDAITNPLTPVAHYVQIHFDGHVSGDTLDFSEICQTLLLERMNEKNTPPTTTSEDGKEDATPEERLL